jgi:hypothetical protein
VSQFQSDIRNKQQRGILAACSNTGGFFTPTDGTKGARVAFVCRIACPGYP